MNYQWVLHPRSLQSRQADRHTGKPMSRGHNQVRQGLRGREVRKPTVVGTDPPCLPLALLLASCVAIGKLLNLSGPHFFNCQVEIITASPKNVFPQ